MSQLRVPAAQSRRSVITVMGAITLAGAALWAAQHAVKASRFGSDTGNRLAIIWLVTFVILAFQTILYHLERPRRLTPRISRQIDALHVAVLIPAYNEDDGYLRLSLESLLQQTRRPNSVHVVDDGSTSGDYQAVRTWWERAARQAGIHTTWQRVPNGGKRHAQGHGVRVSPDADIYVTVDSDSCLDARAIEQLLIPFSKAKVQSVAGVVVATNNRGPNRPVFAVLSQEDGLQELSYRRIRKLSKGRDEPRKLSRRELKSISKRVHRKHIVGWRGQQLMCRMTDLWLLTGQLVDRSAMSTIGAVLVNSGPLAAYRAAIVRDNLDAYLNETFKGKPVMLSDDSLLTLYALLRGRTVQQPTAFVFSAMPEKFGHLSRMYLRWMRGSTIRSMWRLKYLPLSGLAYWLHLSRWFQMALSTGVLLWLLIVEPVRYSAYPDATFLLVPFLIGWAQGLRYLTVVRDDESWKSRFFSWTLMPLAVVWSWTVLRYLRWWGMLTCTNTGWGTRQNGAEVKLDVPQDAAPLKVLLDPYAEITTELDTQPLRRIEIR